MGKYMTYEQRLKLEALHNMAHMPVGRIAEELGFCRQTIYNELKLGEYMHTRDYRDIRRYSADKAQQLHDSAQAAKGCPEKIGHEHAYAAYIERKIIQDKYSPASAIAAARNEGFTFSISVNTLYSYIDKGLFLHLRNRHLWIKGKRRKAAEKQESKVVHPALPSIEQRPKEINLRMEVGHWEMDLIIGKGNTGPVLMTLTERASRRELIFKLPDKKAASVRAVFDKLERTTPDFQEHFKSITTDNGPEFLEYAQLIESVHGGQRFDVYYCHSYSAWEKGTNENHNRMIRRFFPKGTDFTKVGTKKIATVQNWMNDYPRKVLGWTSPNQTYYNLLEQLRAPA